MIPAEKVADMILKSVDKRATKLMAENAYFLIGLYKIEPRLWQGAMQTEIRQRNQQKMPTSKL